MAALSQHELGKAMISLLEELIAIPSFSKEENATADRLERFFKDNNIQSFRKGNNVWVKNFLFDKDKPTLLLNSHHDTVKPNKGYTRDPFAPTIEDGKLYGLGSNDAGGPLLALLGTFLHFYDMADLPFNIIYAATAEEEISGTGGIESIISDLDNIHLAIVGEPTLMNMAVAERGLLVIDCEAQGVAGHAARNEGVNAIYEAMKDIEWFRAYKFEKESEWLGPVGMNVTMINAGTAHNQVPSVCNYTVDIRLNEHYSHQQVLDLIRSHVKSTVKERSTRIKPSFVNMANPIVGAAQDLKIPLYGSPTTSDMALMPWPAVKIGPGDSARSHSADEFIYIQEIEDGITLYISLLKKYFLHFKYTTS
jgi:acetylornithine deacetylase